MSSYAIFAGGSHNDFFDAIVDSLQQAGIDARQMLIADYDRENGYNP